MQQSKYSQFEFWAEQKKNDFPEILRTDKEIEAIEKDTLFLWTSMAAPAGPCGGYTGMWELVPNVDALAGYIRHIWFPNFFDIWLRLDVLDDYNATISAEELFEMAAEEELDLDEDISLMKQLVEEVDHVFTLENSQKLQALRNVLDQFNNRWNQTSFWSFEIYAFTNTDEIGNYLYENYEDTIQETIYEYNVDDEDDEEQDPSRSITKEQWLDICKGIYTNEEDMELFVRLLDATNCF